HDPVLRFGIAARGPPALRTYGVHDRRDVAQGRAAPPRQFNVAPEHHRELLVRYRDRATAFAVHDRDRRAPVALARDQPVMEPVGDRGPADATLLRFGADRGFPHLAAHASERAAPHHDALADVRRLERRVLGAVGADHLANLQSVLLREGEIALVVTGHRHDRARAVGGEHIVGDPDRNPLPGEYVPRERAGVDTGLLTLRRGTLDIRHVASV